MRADKFLANRFSSRTKAAEEIERGRVLVNGKTIKPKDEIDEADEIVFITAEERFVSNGGYKLSRAIKTFGFDCGGKIFADIGASTGGFTDCLLQNGAKKVFAIDVGESLLDETLKGDERIVAMENVNARYLKKEDFPCDLDGIVADLSFISLRLILPVIGEILPMEGVAFVLVKPQFECEGKNIGKSGIVHLSAHKKIVEKVLGYCKEAGFSAQGIVNAPVRKGKNIEYILYLRKTERSDDSTAIVKEVERLVKEHTEGKLL